MTVDNNKQQKIRKNSEARLRANHHYDAKTYKKKKQYMLSLKIYKI